MADRRNPADCKAGDVAHPASIGGLRTVPSKGRYFRQIDPVDAGGDHENQLLAGAQHDRLGDLRHVAAHRRGSVLRGARALGKHVDRVGMAGSEQRGANAFD